MNDIDIALEPVAVLRRLVMNLPSADRKATVLHIHELRPSISIKLSIVGFELCDTLSSQPNTWYTGSLDGWPQGLGNPL